MESVADFVVDQYYLITVAIFYVASVGLIRRSRRRQLQSSGAAAGAGVRSAALAGVLSATVFVIAGVALAWLLSGLSMPATDYRGEPLPSPQPTPGSQARALLDLMAWFVAIPGVAFVAVLDLYALWPLHQDGRAQAVNSRVLLGALISGVLLGQGLLIPATIADAKAAEAERVARAAGEQLARDVEARSAGLSMQVTVVDLEVGAQAASGRIVEYLTLDITVRSATELELRLSEDGLGSNLLLLSPAYAPDASYSPPMYLQLEKLPALIPAGFDATYRLAVPVAGTIRADDLRPDPVTTGTWSADLVLHDRTPGPAVITSVGPVEPSYETSASFTVSDTP